MDNDDKGGVFVTLTVRDAGKKKTWYFSSTSKRIGGGTFTTGSTDGHLRTGADGDFKLTERIRGYGEHLYSFQAKRSDGEGRCLLSVRA